MADFDWPEDLAPYVQSFYLQPYTNRSESPFTRQAKVYGLDRPRWVCRMSFRGGYNGRSGVGAYGPRLDALLARLEGGANRVRLWDFRRPGGAVAFTNSAISSGTTQVTLTGTTDGLRVGDYIGGDDRPHLVVDTEASGSTLIATVKPHFQSAVPTGEATFERVSGLFRLTTDDAGANTTEVGGLTVYDLEFIEDLGAPTDVFYRDEPITYTG